MPGHISGAAGTTTAPPSGTTQSLSLEFVDGTEAAPASEGLLALAAAAGAAPGAAAGAAAGGVSAMSTMSTTVR